ARLAVPLVAVPVLLVPWTLRLLDRPTLLFAEAGLVDPELVDASVPGWMIALGHPGGPGTAPFWMYAPVVLAALAALVRRDRMWGVAVAWLATGCGVLLGVVQSRVEVDVPWLSGSAPAWAGFAAGLAPARLIAAATHGADGVVARFTQMSFSWRQPVAGLLAVVVAVTPVVAAGWWLLRAADGPLERQTAAVLPEYVVREHRTGARPYSLVLGR